MAMLISWADQGDGTAQMLLLPVEDATPIFPFHHQPLVTLSSRGPVGHASD